jgi:hypothetical protein
MSLRPSEQRSRRSPGSTAGRRAADDVRDDVTQSVRRELFGGEFAAADEVGGERVVAGEAGEVAVAEQRRPTVPRVRDE